MVNILLAVLCLIMTVVNFITADHVLAYVTGIFGIACLVNVFFSKIQGVKAWMLYGPFCAETVLLFAFFIISGMPDGGSVQWILIAPAFAMTVLGQRQGACYSACLFAMIVFFFWLPFGKDLLVYTYSEACMLRLPLVFICIFLISWYIHTVQRKTHGTVEDAQAADQRYRQDALTGLYNRQAFLEKLRTRVAKKGRDKAAVMLLDIDDFKDINERYGHICGDRVLQRLAEILRENTCCECISCRWGGGKMAIFMPCDHDYLAMAETIRKHAEHAAIIHETDEVHLTLSIGIAETTCLSRKMLNTFIDQAKFAMFQSQADGKNRVTKIMYASVISHM